DGKTPGTYEVDVTVEYPDGSKDKTKVTVTIKDEEQSEKPKVNQPTEGDDKITGTGKPGAEIVVKDKDGNVIGKTTVDKDGNWEVKVPADKPLNKDDKITVEQTEKGKKPSTAETTVKGKADNGSGNGHINIPFIPDSNADEGNDDKKPEEDNDKKVKTEAEKNPAITPEKTGVKDKNHLTDDEKQEVIDKVKKANPAASDVIVDDKGNATLIYADGSKNFINAEDLIFQVAAQKEKMPNVSGKKAGKNVKTGVGSVSGLLGLAGISIAGLLASRKKEEEDK
ncbi:Ig-like domain-containing protein, partial [uncultured Anaerococcus sp.]|uniref:Ig-like domain-containing protein n=1 Tax=uncultured Anaerococcus sp. TaxID=293428 RepID=UPI00288A12D9